MLFRSPCFVFDADIEGAFDNLNQTVVLDRLQTFPTLRQAINAWLRAGVVDGNTYFTSEKGIAQGGVLSPLLMNVALHGMESVVGEGEILRGTAGDHKGPPSHSSPPSPLREGKSHSWGEWLVAFVFFFHYVFGAYPCTVFGLIPKLV